MSNIVCDIAKVYRNPMRMYWYITDNCNFDYIHCWIDNENKVKVCDDHYLILP